MPIDLAHKVALGCALGYPNGEKIRRAQFAGVPADLCRRIVGCRTGYRPAMPGAPALPCRSGGRGRGESPRPGRCACPRRRDPGPAVPCSRKRCDAPAHSRRRPFFSPALQHQDPRCGVPEDTPHGVARSKSRKAVCVPELSMFSHPGVMPRFPGPCNPKTSCPERG